MLIIKYKGAAAALIKGGTERKGILHPQNQKHPFFFLK